MHDVNSIETYLQLFTEICRSNFRLLDIFLKLYHLSGTQRSTWNSIDTPLHVLHNNTATLIGIPCFDLIINKNTNSQNHCTTTAFCWPGTKKKGEKLNSKI